MNQNLSENEITGLGSIYLFFTYYLFEEKCNSTFLFKATLEYTREWQDSLESPALKPSLPYLQNHCIQICIIRIFVSCHKWLKNYTICS